jgi:hypothetical protein
METDTVMMNSTGVNKHCKLTFNNQIRRFVFTGTEFAELRGQISTLISLPQDGFVLKYVDNESDLITLSTTEEFTLALELSEKVLRLIAEPVAAQQTGTATPSDDFENPWSHFRGGWGHHGHRGRGGWGGPHGHHHGGRGGWGGPHGHHHGGRGGWEGHSGQQSGSPGPSGDMSCTYGYGRGGGRGGWGHHAEKFEEQKMRITTKIEMMKNLLAQMPPEDQSPSKNKLMAQIHRLEGRLIRWDAWIEKKGKKADHKRCKKFDKHDKKHEKKHEKKLEHLSPEALHQYQLLKAQIASLKPTLYELKSAKKEKKSQLETALQQGNGDKEAIWQEILVIKERISEIKKEIKPLKDNIKALKDSK